MTKLEFHTKWLEIFASTLSKKEVEEHIDGSGNFIWHIFSWKQLREDQFLVGDTARAAYNKMCKDNAIYIDWFSDKHTKDITDNLKCATALDEIEEIYVVGKGFNWTYIKTHENNCGPYFMKI